MKKGINKILFWAGSGSTARKEIYIVHLEAISISTATVLSVTEPYTYLFDLPYLFFQYCFYFAENCNWIFSEVSPYSFTTWCEFDLLPCPLMTLKPVSQKDRTAWDYHMNKL